MVVKKEEAKRDAASTEMAREGERALARAPEDMKRDAGVGTESIGADDIRPPRLMLAQSQTPQAKKSDPKYVEGLQEGDWFNDLTEEVYGPRVDKLVVLSFLGARGIEFAPMELGGGVVDFEVPMDDPRMQFTKDRDNPKKSVKPVATKLYDYLVWLPDQEEFVSLSFKGGGLKVAMKLNALLKHPLKVDDAVVMDPPAWARTFSLASVAMRDAKFSWSAPVLKAAGVTPLETREFCASLHAKYAGKRIVVPVDAADAPPDSDDSRGGDQSFDPDKM